MQTGPWPFQIHPLKNVTDICNLDGTDSVGRQARWCPLHVCQRTNVELMHQAGFRVGILQHQKERFKPRSAFIGALIAVSGHLPFEFVTAVHSTCTSSWDRQNVLSVIVEMGHKVRNSLTFTSYKFHSKILHNYLMCNSFIALFQKNVLSCPIGLPTFLERGKDKTKLIEGAMINQSLESFLICNFWK